MDKIGNIGSIVAAAIGIIGVVFSFFAFRNSKPCILKRIEKKERKVNDINNELYNKYGITYSGRGPLDTLEIKKRKLQSEVERLKKQL